MATGSCSEEVEIGNKVTMLSNGNSIQELITVRHSAHDPGGSKTVHWKHQGSKTAVMFDQIYRLLCANRLESGKKRIKMARE